MQLLPSRFGIIYEKFSSSWNLDRIMNMTISDYADLSNKDSLCYWLEYGTEQLGAIGGIPLNKFELWKLVKEREFKDDRFKVQDGYAWSALKGNTLNEAFSYIRQLIIEIITLSQKQDWQAIEAVPFHAIGKWKLAFLFSGKRLLPIYSKRALLAIGKGMGVEFGNKDSVSEMQSAILSNKPENEDILEFAHRIYCKFAEKVKMQAPNFYIIGSKYGPDFIMDTFIDKNCVAMGFLNWLDFSPYIGANPRRVDQFVEENYDGPRSSLGKVKGYFRLFSQIKEGDVFAIKAPSERTQVKIIGYAQVVVRDGRIYFHDEDLLGHHIHVEFLEAGFIKAYKATYASTIHRLTPEKDEQKFYDIFGWYPSLGDLNGINSNEGTGASKTDELDEEYEEGEGYRQKMESSFVRSAGASVIVRRLHNQIQNQFVKYLKAAYPADKISGEKSYIDAKRIDSNSVYIYEIKPSCCVYSCIRQAIGQLLDYMHQEKSKKAKKLVVVGPGQPTEEDLLFLTQIKTVLNVPLSYMVFDHRSLTVTEF